VPERRNARAMATATMARITMAITIFIGVREAA
jgi:hypothetical protein